MYKGVAISRTTTRGAGKRERPSARRQAARIMGLPQTKAVTHRVSSSPGGSHSAPSWHRSSPTRAPSNRRSFETLGESRVPHLVLGGAHERVALFAAQQTGNRVGGSKPASVNAAPVYRRPIGVGGRQQQILALTAASLGDRYAAGSRPPGLPRHYDPLAVSRSTRMRKRPGCMGS